MNNSRQNKFSRRRFVHAIGSVGALRIGVAAPNAAVSLVADPHDSVAGAGPVQWALHELEQTLKAAGGRVQRYDRLAAAPSGNNCILAAGAETAQAAAILKRADVRVPSIPESLGIVQQRIDGRKVTLASANDARGLVYALLDLADRVDNADNPAAALAIDRPVVEQPANKVRSIARLFTSDVHDKPWYNDREMWPNYLTMLASERFNRFNLSFGIGYDFITHVTDAYFLFAYPFLFSVPGYNVRVPQLPDAERDRNLAMLRYISEQTAARGLHFQLGLWMHGYKWLNSPSPNYTIEGLTPETHGPYCRDAVRMLLKACPAINGITFRIHGESGVEEGSFDFWKTVFEGVAGCGRPVEIDMHAKGMNQNMLDVGIATGMPLKVSPKYWAEHLGMPYHQAEIREEERPKTGKQVSALMKFSAGSRSFLRYGYGDLLREDRRWGVLTRIWPGTQRLLIWGDPLTAAAHARAFSFCGSDGVEICEPLSFKGRRGSGIAGDRCGYADASLRPRWDWEKYLYTYRVWGRLTYNPDTDPGVWRRPLRKRFGDGAEAVEGALANASRILPIVTTAYCPSAANNNYWPELYTNQSLLDAAHYTPYSDTLPPRVFPNASPLDPQLFSSMNECADELLGIAARSGKYSPIEVAQWLEDYASAALTNLKKADAQARAKDRPEYRRMAIDIAMQAGLGRFFAAKFRAGVLYRIFEQTGDRAALDEALNSYRRARAAWADLAARAKGIYVTDITVGEHPWLRGHWLDRLPAIEADIEAVARQVDRVKATGPEARTNSAIQQALGRPRRPQLACRHTAPSVFNPGKSLDVEVSIEEPATASVRLIYRHVNQGERWESTEMQRRGSYRASVLATYTDSPYPLQYYFEVRLAPGDVWIYPGFAQDLNNQPYYVVRWA